MKGLAISNKGMEDITAKEIAELVGVKTEIKQGCVIFECKQEDLAHLSYKGQSINRVLELKDQFKIKKVEDLKRISKIDFGIKGTFAVRSEIKKNEYSRSEIEKTAGDHIEGKVDLEKPEVKVFVYIYGKECYVGIDYSDDISKREYKIMTHRTDIKGPLAYALVRLSGYTRKGTLLDPFIGNGTITIEASLYGTGKSANYHDKNKFPLHKLMKIDLAKFDEEKKATIHGLSDELRHVKAAQKNALVAETPIEYSKLEVEWIDTKFKKEEVDYIVTNGPRVTQYNEKKAQKLYKELFYQANYALKKTGTIVVGTNRTEIVKEMAKKEKFVLQEEREIEYGEEKLKIATFKKE